MPWALPAEDAALLALSKGYPFPVPDQSYLFREGRHDPLSAVDFDGRWPVIAHGSNRSPEQLRRKYGDNAEIPVVRGRLADYDVVYSAHMSRYGSIAATLHHTPGTSVEVWVTWLDSTQLEHMHATELGGEIYSYGSLEGVSLSLENGPSQLDRAYAYLSRNGCLAVEGSPVALAAVEASARRYRALHQEAAQDHVRERLRPQMSLDQMILHHVRRPSERLSLIAELRREAVGPEFPHFQVLKESH